MLARSFVASDPGGAFPAPLGGFIVTAGWFVLLFGTSLWHARVRPGRLIGGWIALGLAVTTALVVLRAVIGTPNGWLASLTTWQWLALPAAYVAVRQLTADRFDSRGLMAAILATGVAAIFTAATPQVASNWLEPTNNVRLTPEGADEIGTAFDVRSDLQGRAWSKDLLWLTLVLPLALAFAFRIRKVPPMARVSLLIPVVLLVVGIGTRWVLESPPLPASWRPALDIFATSPAGVGPGLYSRYTARHAPPDAAAVCAEPPNSYLGFGATSGSAALLALVATIWMLTRSLRSGIQPPEPLPDNLTERTRWELYAGGLIGLMGGLALQAYDWPAVERPPMVILGIAVAVRGFVWFSVLACAERAMSLTLFDLRGGLGLFLALAAAVLYDVLRPGLAEAFWATAAVAVNLAAPPAESAWAQSRVARILPVLVAVSLLMGFTVLAFLPTLESATYANRAVKQMPNYAAKLHAIERADGPPAKTAARSEAARFIRRFVVQPLLSAMSAGTGDAGSEAIVEPLLNGPGLLPLNVAPAIVAAPWCIAAWEHGSSGDYDKLGIVCSLLGQKFDAANVAGFLTEFEARLRFASLSATKRDEQFERTGKLMAEILRRDPALEARLRFRVAAAYFAAGNTKLGMNEAAAAHELDDRAAGPRYRLSNEERQQVQTWLGKPSS